MDAIFEGGVQPEVATENVADASKKAKVKEMKEALKVTLQTDTSFASKLRTWSKDLEVVNTLGYGKGGNIIVDKAASTATDRKLTATSQIVGYIVKNIGSEAMKYTTEVYTQDETGKYVGQVVEKTLAPGATVALTRQYMTMFCAQPEISFTLANGKIVASSRKAAKNSVKEELASYYFSFNKGEDGTALQVNDNEVKISIDTDGDGIVKPEFIETFGFLNNPKAARGTGAPKGSKFTTQDLAANYINQLLKTQGM